MKVIEQQKKAIDDLRKLLKQTESVKEHIRQDKESKENGRINQGI